MNSGDVFMKNGKSTSFSFAPLHMQQYDGSYFSAQWHRIKCISVIVTTMYLQGGHSCHTEIYCSNIPEVNEAKEINGLWN